MAELTPKQRKTFAKITEALQEFPFGATIQDLYNEARLSMTVIKNALEKMDSVEQRGDSWFLKTTDGSRAGEAVEPTVEQPVMQDSAENLQDNTENMQEDIGNTQDAPVNIEDEELNTEAPQVSSPDNESSSPDNGEGALINPSAEVTNPSAKVVNPSDIDTDTDQQDITEVGRIIVSIDDLHPEFAQLPDYQDSNSQAIETASQGLAAELKQLDNAHLDGLISKTDAKNAEVSQANRHEFFGGDKVYVLNAGSPYIHKIDWVENNQLGTVHFKDSMDSRSQKWLLSATKENHAKLCDLMPWIEWQRPELVGSDLMLKILEDDEVWLCRVGNDGDENCSFEDIRLVIGQHDEKGFFVAGRGDIAFKNAVPVNVHGVPLTESDVFGAA